MQRSVITGVRNNLNDTPLPSMPSHVQGERVQTIVQSMQDTCKTKWQWGLFIHAWHNSISLLGYDDVYNGL